VDFVGRLDVGSLASNTPLVVLGLPGALPATSSISPIKPRWWGPARVDRPLPPPTSRRTEQLQRTFWAFQPFKYGYMGSSPTAAAKLAGRLASRQEGRLPLGVGYPARVDSEVLPRTHGHAFISYVREDTEEVRRLQDLLEAAGIRVWRDTDDLWPGQDWRLEIRKAITSGSLAFLACFSKNSAAKEVTYQNEELILAVEQMRLRAPGRPWLIPIRLSECTLPLYDLGAGRDLNALQRIDLFDEYRERGTARLIAAVLGVLPRRTSAEHETPSTAPAPAPAPAPARGEVVATASIRELLLNADRQIQLDDLVNDTANEVRRQLLDESEFPASSPRLTNDANGLRFLVEQVRRYATTIAPLVELLVPGCTWGTPQHSGLWARAVQVVARTDRVRSGNTALIALQRYPMLLVLYAAGIAAVHRRNFSALKAVTVDATVRDAGKVTPVIATAHVWRPFQDLVLVPNILALEDEGKVVDDATIEALRTGKKGKRHTPVSDHLFTVHRQSFRNLISDDDDYMETFDRLEVLLSLIATDDELLSKTHRDGPSGGAFTWRHRYAQDPIEQQMQEELAQQQRNWPPIVAGLFGSSVDRATSAFAKFLPLAQDVRRRQF
jgi:hypothetical protein